MNLQSYRHLLNSEGDSLAEVKRNQSDNVINNTFTFDPSYKRIYILTKDGWKFEDAKYQFHTAKSILRDDVDYYLQFRPKVHYPIGSYVIIPDDTSSEINLTTSELRNPFEQPINKRTQWWIIVNRDESSSFVRYNVLRCNWEFKWLWKGEINRCFGIIRSAQSYTSGVWRDEISATTDNLSSAWLPDIYYTYGDRYKDLGLYDNRTIMHGQRFILSNNIIDPKVYQTTKIVDLNPQGIIKLTFKQDELNEKTDNIQLNICDYYNPSGENLTNDSESEKTSIIGTSEIKAMCINKNGELDFIGGQIDTHLHIGGNSYFSAVFSSSEVKAHWHISCLNDENTSYYEGLIKIKELNSTTVSLKPSKAKSLIGKRFRLSVSDENGCYYSSIDLEVS